MMKEKKQKKSFVLFADFMPAIFALSDEQAGKLFKLIFLYANDMDLPQRNLLPGERTL